MLRSSLASVPAIARNPGHVVLPVDGDDHASSVDHRVKDVDANGVQPTIKSVAPHLERQGLYIHSFQCVAGSLELALLS